MGVQGQVAVHLGVATGAMVRAEVSAAAAYLKAGWLAARAKGPLGKRGV